MTHYEAADRARQPRAFARRAVISIGQGAALQLRGDAPSGVSVSLKNSRFNALSLLWHVTVKWKCCMLLVLFFSADFSSFGWAPLSPDINFMLFWDSWLVVQCAEILLAKKILVLLLFNLCVFKLFRVLKQTIVVFIEPKGVYGPERFKSFWPFLCQGSPRAQEPKLQEKRGHLQDKVGILLRTKPATNPFRSLEADELTLSMSFTSQRVHITSWELNDSKYPPHTHTHT